MDNGRAGPDEMGMNAPLLILPTPATRQFRETEIEHFQRVAFEQQFEMRRRRREARRARLRSLIQRAA
jgi:hypothetical protein